MTTFRVGFGDPMKHSIFVALLTACGGSQEVERQQETSVGQDTFSPVAGGREIESTHPRAPDAADEAHTLMQPDAWTCQPCCLNAEQWNCLGGNASLTRQCTDPGAPAVCNAVTHECVGLKCF